MRNSAKFFWLADLWYQAEVPDGNKVKKFKISGKGQFK